MMCVWRKIIKERGEGMLGGFVIWKKVVKIGFLEKVIFEYRFEGGEGVDILIFERRDFG